MQSRVPYCLGPERGGGVHVHEDLVRIGLQGGPTIRQGGPTAYMGSLHAGLGRRIVGVE